ncbi:MAG TPA: 5'-methylthioadenosine/adenosylhomocysteine nucleosidase [Chitinophagaceae bacterium]|jgi:adenosylhomocysteine nucleosidase
MNKISLVLLVIVSCTLQQVSAQAPVKPIDSPHEAPIGRRNGVTGILGAFADETELLLGQVQQKKEVVIRQIHFTQGLLRGRPVVIAQSGIGKVNAAVTTALMLEHFQPSEIVFTGIAGAVDPALIPGDLVIATKVAYHDYGSLLPDSMQRRSTRNPTTMQENPIYFPCDKRLLQVADMAGKTIVLEKMSSANGSVLPKIVEGVIVTGDVFVSSQAATQKLYRQMNAEATEMEGAAVGQVCYQQQTPFIIIRSMSDNAGNNAYLDVKSFYRIAARNSASLVMAIMEMLAQHGPRVKTANKPVK